MATSELLLGHAIRKLAEAPLASSRRIQTGCPSWMIIVAGPDHSENNELPWVRSHRQLGAKSSKRVQTGEPNFVFPDASYLIDFILCSRRELLWIALCAFDPRKDSNLRQRTHPGCIPQAIHTHPASAPAIIVVLSLWARELQFQTLELAANPWPNSGPPTIQEQAGRGTSVAWAFPVTLR